MPSPGEDIQSWSVTAANNGTADPLINWVEGQARASVNNSARSQMAAHAKDRNLKNGSIVTTGAPNAQAFLSGVNYTALPTGLGVKLKVGPGLTNTSAVTLNCDGIGAVTVKTADGVDTLGGEFVAGGYVDLLYNGTNWIFEYGREFFHDLITSGGGIVIGQQKFATAGSFSYVPSSGMECCTIEALAGGGAGGGIVSGGGGGILFWGGGGGAGGYSRVLKTAAEISAALPIAITVGAGGAGLAGANGGNGGDTSVGTLCIALGGKGGTVTGPTTGAGGLGGAAGTGDIVATGASGEGGYFATGADSGSGFSPSGQGGSSNYGGGAVAVALGPVTVLDGNNAGNYGSGGSGAYANAASGSGKGGNGSSGLVIITEFAGRGAPGATGPAGPIGPAGPSGPGTGDVLVSGTPTAGQYAQWTDASHIAGVTPPTQVSPPQGRLTLQTATPIMTTTQSAKTTIFYTPAVGNLVPIYNGSAFAMMAFAELSQATTDTTKSPAAVVANSVYDLFAWSDAGTLRCTRGPAWTNDTTRSAGTVLVMTNGVLLNNVSITNGPAAQRGTYVGTVRSNAASQIDWIFGASAAGGSAAFFGVWNAYNAVTVVTNVIDTTASWTYAGPSWRNVNSSANNRISFVRGLDQDGVRSIYKCLAWPAGLHYIGISLDGVAPIFTAQSNVTTPNNQTTTCEVLPGTGLHYFQAQENASAGTGTWYGLNGSAQTMMFSGILKQ